MRFETLEKEFERISKKVFEENNENMSKAYQKIAQLCEWNSNETNSYDINPEYVFKFWDGKAKEMRELAQGLSRVVKVTDTQNTDIFKTDFKFSSKEERTLYQRFVEAPRTSGNKYMFYTVTDKEFNYRTEDFKYFFNLNENVLERFDEITNYEYVIVDKKFLLNNEFSNQTPAGKRYIYYVDTDDFNESSKNNPREHSVLSKRYKFAKVFRSYEALLEHLETNVTHKAIYVIGENAFNGLRYVIDSIEIVVCDRLNIESNELVSHNFNNYEQFLSFCKYSDDVYTQKEKVIEKVEVKENFSNHIRFAQSSKKTKEVIKNIDYQLLKITRAGLKPVIYRHARRSKNYNDHSRFVQIKNVLLEIDDKNKLQNITTYDEGHIKNSTDYLPAGRNLTQGISFTQKELSNFNKETIDEIAKIIQIQIIG